MTRIIIGEADTAYLESAKPVERLMCMLPPSCADLAKSIFAMYFGQTKFQLLSIIICRNYREPTVIGGAEKGSSASEPVASRQAELSDWSVIVLTAWFPITSPNRPAWILAQASLPLPRNCGLDHHRKLPDDLPKAGGAGPSTKDVSPRLPSSAATGRHAGGICCPV